MFASRSKGIIKKSKEGRIYVLRVTLSCGTVVHKVGMTHSDRATDRMMEILRSFFSTYRYVPMCELKRDKQIQVPRLVETHLHQILDEWSYTFDKKFGGSTEFFYDLDETVLLDYLDNFDYRDLLTGRTVMKEGDLADIVTVINSQEVAKIKISINEDEIPF